MSLNQQQTYGISEDIKMKKNKNNSNSSTRTSIDQAHNRPSIMNQSHLSLKSLLDLRSITNKQDINHNSNFDKDSIRYSIADQPLTKLSLTLPSLTNEQQQQQQQNIYFSDIKYILLLASFVCTILQFYNSNSYSWWWWYISSSWWGLFSLFTVRFFSIHHAPFFCRLGQCSVIFFCASMITKINFQEIYLSIMHLFNNLFMALNPHYHHHNSNNNINKGILFYFQQIIPSLSSSSLPSSSSTSSTLVLFNNEWSDYGIILLWMGSYGMFHMVQRLCNHYQTRQQLFNALQHQSQQKVDNYLNDEMSIRQQFIDTLTREMQEAALMVLSTLEQFAPLTVLQHTHELLSPCSLPVPVVNISAIHTVVFEMGQMGSHLRLIASLLRRQKQQINKLDEKDDMKNINNSLITTTTTIQREFDIGELIQTVGDALAAMASKLGISFILYHMDNGLHCVNVLGDESAIKYGLMILLRNIMEGCTPGASIEVGLNIESHGQHRIQITFDILQSRSLAIPQSIAASELKLNVFTTESIRYSHGTLSIGKVNDISTRYLVLYNLPSGSDNTQKRLIMERSLLDLRNKVQYASEPTLKELIDFIEKLKGKRMILYATEKSIFAKHVTSCLASWNVDISHIPTSTITSIMTSHSSSSSTTTSNLSPSLTAMSTGSTTTSISSTSSSLPGAPPSMKTPTPATEEEHIHSIPPTFLLIDDDINTLDKLLQDYRNQHLQQQQQQQQHHHQQHMATTTPITPSSSISLTSIQQELANNTSSSSSTRKSRRQQKTMAIIYFSYLKDYRRVREVIMQSVSVGIQPPRVIIIPKPAGPRRFLTALHMGWYDSIIDPQFAPMATSPLNCPPHQHYAVAQAMTSPASFLYSTGSTALTPPTPNESIKRSSSPGGPSVSRHEESHMNYFSPRPTSTTTTTTTTTNTNTTTTSNDTNNNGNLGIPSFGGSGSTATNRSPPHHLSTTTTTAASTTTTTTTNPLISSSPSAGLTGAASSSSSSSSLPALVSSANANSRRRVRSKSSTFHPPNRRMVDLTFPSSPLAIDSKLQQGSHYYQHHHPNGFTPLNSIDLDTLTTTSTKQHTSLSSDIDNNNINHSQTNLGIGIDIPIHDQLIDSFNLESNLHDNNNSADVNDMTSPLRISINSSMNDQQQLPSATTATTTTSSSLLIHHNDNENHQYYQQQQQQQQQERHHDITLSSSMAGPLTSNDMTIPHSDHNNNNINSTNEIHDTSEPSNNTASTNQITSPKQPNLKFKISNRKKKDKNKHTPWWSPPINVLIVEDNMINQAILSTWMKKHKIKYEVASDGKQAVEKWKKGGFHLILMDIQLPVMSGIDATKTIREIEKDKKIGVLPSKWDHVDNGIPKQGDALTNDNTTTAIHVTQENKGHNDMTASTTTATATTTTTTINTTNPTSSSYNNEEVEESILTATATATATAAAFQSPVIIVALTASSHESDRQAALSAGCNDFLTKPVSLEWLEKKIMEWGCMQALIDVEGWRQWKRITQHSPSSSITQKTSMATATPNLPSIAPSSSLSTVPLPSSPTDTTTTTTTITTAPPNNTLDKISSHSNNGNNNQSIPLSHTHHQHNQHHHHHHKRKEELESIPPTLISNNNDNNSNHGHGIILQGASTLMNKRVSMKTRMVLRGVDS